MNLNNLAQARAARVDLAEAESLYRRSLAIKDNLLGREHPDAGLTALNLASLLLERGRPEEALPLAQCAERAFTQLGPDHPNRIALTQLLE